RAARGNGWGAVNGRASQVGQREWERRDEGGPAMSERLRKRRRTRPSPALRGPSPRWGEGDGPSPALRAPSPRRGIAPFRKGPGKRLSGIRCRGAEAEIARCSQAAGVGLRPPPAPPSQGGDDICALVASNGTGRGALRVPRFTGR